MTPTFDLWRELFLVLGCGVAAIAACGWFISRAIALAAWQRAVWLTAIVSISLLLVVEISGAGRVLASLASPTSPTKSTTPANPASPSTASQPTAPQSTTSAAVSLADIPTFTNAAALDQPIDLPATELAFAPTTLVVSTVTVAPNARWQLGWWPAVVWCLVSLVLVSRMLSGRRAVRRLTINLPHCDDPRLLARVRQMAAALHIPQLPDVRSSGGIPAPFVCGIRHPLLVLPENFGQAHTEPEQSVMLAHELGHLAGNDPWWLCVADFLCCVLWWHPLAWFAKHQFRAACEAAADEASTSVAAGPETLATCLVRLGRQISRRRQVAFVGVLGSGFRSGLGRRVQRLLQLQGRSCARPGRARIAVVCFLGVVLCVGLTTLATLGARPTQPISGDTAMRSFGGSWRTTLAGAALLSLFNGPALAQDGPKDPPKDGERPAARREERPDRPRDAEGPAEANQVRQQMRELREAMMKAREAGKADEVQAIEQKMKELVQRIQREGGSGGGAGGASGGDRRGPADGPRPDGPPRDGEQGPPRERMRLIMEAAERLRAAGMQREAEELVRRAREQGAEGQRRPDDAPRPEGRPNPRPEGRPEGRPDNRPDARPEGRPESANRPDVPRPPQAPNEDLIRVIRELKNEIDQLRKEVNELRSRNPRETR